MAFRLNDEILGGEIDNTRPYATTGWLQLRGVETPVILDLTGDCHDDLKGRRIRFEPRPLAEGECAGDEDEDGEKSDAKPVRIHPQQVGPTGDMTADSWVKTFTCSVKEFYNRCKAGEPPPTTWKRRLYLEWYSQNGRVVIELADPILEALDGEEWKEFPTTKPKPEGDETPSGGGGLEISVIQRDGDETTTRRYALTENPDGEGESEGEGEDPGKAFEKQLERQSRAVDRAIQDGESISDDETSEEDERAISEMELIDELIEKEIPDPVSSVFSGPRRLAKADDLPEDEVEPLLKSLLMEMAMAGIALHVCEHFTPRDTYRLLVERLCHEEGFYPQLRGTGWVQHFLTSEFCPACESQAELDYEESKKRREAEGDVGAGTDADAEDDEDPPF